MAIYHCSTKTISRSAGRTSVASSAYRSGEKLQDERTGLTHDFTKKTGIEHTEIISNLGVDIDRNELWNAAEQAENRKDARTAREWIIALPDELDTDQRQNLAKDFARFFVDRYDVVADLAIHEPSKHGDERNHHAHIMLTTRKAVLDPHNKLQLTEKAEIELSNTKRTTFGLGTSQEEIKIIRQAWAKLANQHLEHAGHQQTIDHRSHADKNNGLQATIHEGNKVTQLRRQGITTDISRYNDYAKQHNTKAIKLQQQSKENQLQRGLGRVEQGFEQWQQKQATKRLELERQAQQTKQQSLDKSKIEQVSVKELQKSDRGGWTR